MTNYRWLDRETILAIHEEQLAQHGGGVGIRDEGLIESALGRPQNIAIYNPEADLCDLAAAYAYGIAKNHPFIDGNKRTAYVAMELFLIEHGMLLTAEDGDAVVTFLGLAAGEITEEQLAAWIRSNAETMTG
ncbi:MAG: type II toxin-antitoxin system death-on-curing family toxin [Methylocystis sp.]|jgi:death-on-curing protein|nr:type II toxin-antitoxin system death-on-curing family toxin [Methylocystis sp.]MCA3585515.1 type II toxin-antitoxin system death-on-curing family toxin [Methylocystis sp.]MCA3588761.1 type II toxin-antitoxin system death-on-curing family toxin [Methylocystis sp.]MCA3590302.1 type II toxin-antitoxin system death-on-curing family toxin [Methylocystis sp.]